MAATPALASTKPGQPWTKLVAAQATNGAAARTADDQAIIVVTDSDTGEVRACGDLSGYCVGMNPWKSALPASQLAPVNLTEHTLAQPANAEAPSSAAASP
jgi:hypothetical protein